MKIGLLGTRGIPNQYGGFEEFAEKVSERWVNAGHEVIVYCEGQDDGEDVLDNGVRRIFIKTQERWLRGGYLFLFDFQCTLDALRRGCDVCYHAGYASAVLGNMLLSRRLKHRLVYNMDGLEWARSKWPASIKSAIKIFEGIAAKSDAVLVSDNKGIQDYLLDAYNVDSHMIAYGAEKVVCTGESLSQYGLKQGQYNILVARFEPENNLEPIIRAHISRKKHLVVVANKTTQHFRELEFLMNESPYINFLGPVYDKNALNDLRAGALFYFHGHMVGGTNPSLLEALACRCRILAHDNPFNRDVLGDFGHFWKNSLDIQQLLDSHDNLSFDVAGQLKLVEDKYSWDLVAKQHLSVFQNMLKQG